MPPINWHFELTLQAGIHWLAGGYRVMSEVLVMRFGKRHSQFVLLLTGLLVVSGCSDADKASSFVYSPKTTALMKEAQEGVGEQPGVRELVDQRFGTPQDLHAWLKLPVDFGGLQAAVAEAPEAAGAVDAFQMQLSEGAAGTPESGAVVQFLTGACAGEVGEVFSWDAESGLLVLQEPLTAHPAAGDQVVIDGGSTLKHGRGLYMRHCSHCHGASGDGQGPTAKYLNPRPRDYRNGVFKFTSTTELSKVSRDDLSRVLKYGIPGTYMPSFLLLEDEELHALVEYVRFLAMRGEFERGLATELTVDFSQAAVDDRVRNSGESRADIVKELEEFLAGDLPDSLTYISDDLAERWSVANEPEARVTPDIPRVPDTVESRRRGRELYLSKTLNCADCHGAYGGGDGPQTVAFEKNPATGDFYEEPGLHDVWDNLNQPRNLSQGIYRGGRRPIDLFSRIHAGIKGSRMPSFKNTPHEDIWHVVNYVLSIPFEAEPGATGLPAEPAGQPVASVP